MSNVSEILVHALALPPADRATLVHSLIQSLPASPRIFTTEHELATELELRINETASGEAPTLDVAETMQRAREAVRQVRK